MFKVDFVGIGSGKCGSTWFFDNLVKHPAICDCNPKEINFFSDLYDKGLDWYASNFACCGSERLKGEFSVTYMYNPQAARRIYEHNPAARLIAIVRDPIPRTYSDYWHFIRKGDIPSTTPFSEYIRDEKRLRFGDYTTYLKPFFEQFPSSSIKVLVLEEFSADNVAGFREVYRFLGVEPAEFVPPEVDKWVNVGRNYRFLKLENIMVRSYRMLAKRGHTRLTEIIKRSGIPELFRKINTRSGALPPMPEDCRARLREHFGPRNAELARLIDRDLSRWV